MDVTTTIGDKRSEEKGERIRWAEYLRRAMSTIVVGLILIGLLFLIYWLSNPTQFVSITIYELSLLDNLMLIIASSVLFLGVITWYSKNIILDEKESFGINDMKSKKAVTIVFTSSCSFQPCTSYLMSLFKTCTCN